MMNFLKSYSHFSNILYKDFPRVSYLSNMKGIFNVKFIGKQYIKAKQFQLKFSFYFRFLGKTKSKHVEDRPSRFNQKSGEWTLSEMPKPWLTIVGKTYLKLKCSKTSSGFTWAYFYE